MSATATAPCECEVVIVGAGIAGASAAYHLMKSGISNVVIIGLKQAKELHQDEAAAPPWQKHRLSK
jgi:glycine/D-amino acid oxidase-like deaminating enzyme